jgi:cysteinyl-tRNA synthetase
VLGLENLLATETLDAPADVLELVEARERARAAREFDDADRLREELASRGWEVRDGAEGPELVPRRPM